MSLNLCVCAVSFCTIPLNFNQLGVSIPENPKETPMIVSELCSNGDLFDYIRNVAPPHLNKVVGYILYASSFNID